MARAAVALGANLGDRRATLDSAVAMIAREIGAVVARSAWLETAALIHPDDPAQSYPAYLNGVVLTDTDLPPLQILVRLHAIETALGRDRSKETARWRPRLIDLDLVALDDTVLDTPDLVLPHPEMHNRSFVLSPMCEVWPDWRHPRLGRTTRELVAALEN
ncbi:MAG: 2-amino-4-hydroxy-6-hydroxymethyldihydropteridine diphosphokinase [Geminicoccaceae bacterium]